MIKKMTKSNEGRKGLRWLSASESHIRKASQDRNTAGQEPRRRNPKAGTSAETTEEQDLLACSHGLLSLLPYKTQGHLSKGDAQPFFKKMYPVLWTGQSYRLFSQPKALVPGVSSLGQVVKNTKQDTAILLFAMFKERMKTTYKEFMLAPDMKIQLIGVTKAWRRRRGGRSVRWIVRWHPGRR